MNELRATQVKIFKWSGGMFLVLSILSFFIFSDSMPIIRGLLFGTLIGSLNFMLLSATLSKAVTMNPSKAQNYTIRQYFTRYLLMAVVLFISVKADYIHVLGTVVGLLLIKVAIFITNLFNNGAYFKKIFKREEDV